MQWVPDFVFNHPAFHPLNTASHSVDQLRSAIAGFDIDNPKHLDHVVDLLLASYSQFQLAQLQATPWAAACLQPELQAIANHQHCRLAFVPGGATGGDQVRLAVPLTMVDLAQLQPFICNTWALEYEYEQVGVDSLSEQLQLIVVYTLARGRATPGVPELQLEVPRALETFLGGSGEQSSRRVHYVCVPMHLYKQHAHYFFSLCTRTTVHGRFHRACAAA